MTYLMDTARNIIGEDREYLAVAWRILGSLQKTDHRTR